MCKDKLTLIFFNLLVFLSLVTFPAQAQSKQTKMDLEKFGYKEIIILRGNLGSFEIYIPVSKGLHPTTFETKLTLSNDIEDAFFEIWNGDIPLFSKNITQKEQIIQIDLSDTKIVQDKLNLSIRLQNHSRLASCDALYIGNYGTLTENSISFSGQVEQPKLISDFLLAIAEEIYILLPKEPDIYEVESSLHLSQKIATYYRSSGQKPQIIFVDEPQKVSGNYQTIRVFQVETSKIAGISLDLSNNYPVLKFHGEAENLILQVATYANKNLHPLLLSGQVTVDYYNDLFHTYDKLPLNYFTLTPMVFSGIGEMETSLFFTQSDFGGPIKEISVHMKGVYTSIPDGVRASIKIFYNNNLIISDMLNNSGTYETFFVVPTRLIERDNEFKINITYPPQNGKCELGEQKIFTFDIDELSYIQVKRGQNLPVTIHRYPQVLLPSFQITFDSISIDKVAAMSSFLETMQNTTKTELQFELIKWEKATSTNKPLVVVSSPNNALKRFNSPLQIEPISVHKEQVQIFSTKFDEINTGLIVTSIIKDRNILILSYINEIKKLTDMVMTLRNKPTEWYLLDQDVIVFSGDRFINLDSEYYKSKQFSFIADSFSSYWYQYRIWVITSLGLILLIFLVVLLRGSIVRRSASKELSMKMEKNKKNEI
jgi:hypothetical protein